MKTNSGIEQRLRFVLGVFKLEHLKSLNWADVIKNQEFLDFLTARDSRFSSEFRFSCLYLFLLGRYPSEDELFKALSSLTILNLKQTIYRIVNEAEFFLCNCLSKNVTIYESAPSKLVVDVTHTLYYPFHSGIQRVVRSFVESLRRNQRPFVLISFDRNDQRPFLLNNTQSSIFFNWRENLKTNQTIKSGQYTNLTSKLKLAIIKGCELFGLNKQILLKNKTLFRFYLFYLKSKKIEPQIIQVPFLYEKNLIIPELCADKWRINLLLNIIPNMKAHTTLIFYDLIPIYYPEYCKICEEFNYYLKLLRVVNRVSCISKDTELKLSHFSKNVTRSKELILKTHYLGIDTNNTSRDPIATDNQRPKVLCVGTIEPRKNHTRILRAAVQLLSEGLQFELIFAGQPGWLNQAFYDEFNSFNSEHIKIKNGLSEDELAELYRACRFTVFCSIAEGFGLPILESVYYKKPCLTSNEGSQAEVARISGGSLMVNPTDQAQITSGFRALLTDQALFQNLTIECEDLKWNSWDDYSDQVFAFSTSEDFK